jgi:hypothetical protein
MSIYDDIQAIDCDECYRRAVEALAKLATDR